MRARVRRGEGMPGAAALALALLASVCVARAQYCDILYKNDTKSQCVNVRGTGCHVVDLIWGDDVTRAASALLLVALRRELRYTHVQLRHGPRDLCDLSHLLVNSDDNSVAAIDAGNYRRLAVALSASWRASNPTCRTVAANCMALRGAECGPAGARLRVLGAAATPPLRLHARLAPYLHRDSTCETTCRWAFYANASALHRCAFTDEEGAGKATVYVPADAEWNDTRRELEVRIADAGSRVRVEPLARADLMRKVNDATSSFLFLDWALWANANVSDTNVFRVVPPPCAPVLDSCESELDSAVVLRVADVSTLRTYAPPMFDVVRQFTPEHSALRAILEAENHRNGGKIEEAACEWVINNEQTFRSWIPEKFYGYNVIIIHCAPDPALDEYETVTRILQDEISNLTGEYGFEVELRYAQVDCSNRNLLRSTISAMTQFFSWPRLIGCVAGGEGVAAAAEVAEDRELLLVQYDVPPAAGRALAATGNVAQLALAVRRFCADHGWRRLAVLSEPTRLAEDLIEAMKRDATLAVRDIRLPPNTDKLTAEKALIGLQNDNARVFLVNAEPNAVAAVFAAAVELRMTSVKEYAWIARDWYNGSVANMTHFMISFRYRGGEVTPSDEGRADLHKKLSREFGNSFWPPRTVPLIDATLTLVHGFKQLLVRNQFTRHDVHATGIFRSFHNCVIVEPAVMGVAQKLHYQGYSLANPLVFVEKWQNGDRIHVATWRVSGDLVVTVKAGGRTYEPGDGPPSDGTWPCSVPSGDAFTPSCHDVAVAVGATALALTPLAACAVWWATRRLLTRRDLLLTARVLARRERAVAALAAHVVDRKAIEIREELGSGRFGRVWLALLREPGRTPRAVAAKTLRDDAAPSEESEFLREACALASLDHEHVVRFVGVCAVGGPPLVLMEHAFFGDLLRYLRARRHLAEGASVETGGAATASCSLGKEEAAHVSASALTRLAREAASALGYLALRGVVHRDVRASNCLVDARRSLKLADFGMARETRAEGVDGAAEYACRRRGLFPVLWMAPESLLRGVFSAASDVWGLGVLVLELVTLGARPYGAWSPLRVLQFVAAGGRPALPLDATAQTRGLALSCWRRTAEERPTAAEVVAYLASHPRALRPALLPMSLEPRPDSADPTDSDSGFGETPFPDFEQRFLLE